MKLLINEDSKLFLTPFCPTDLVSDPVPIKVYRNSITKNEAVGQAIHWTFEYLFQRNCPPQLMDFILGCVRMEVKNQIVPGFDTLPEGSSDALDSKDASMEPLNLMHTVIKTVDDLLLKIKDIPDDQELEAKYPEVYKKSGLFDLSKDPLGSLRTHNVSYFGMKNQRRTMEDKLVVFPNMQEVFDLNKQMSYFAVFDGHNGAEAAAYAAAQLHQILIDEIKKTGDVKEALMNAFTITDELFLEKCKSEKIRSGTTGVAVVMDKQKLYVAWVGDSQVSLYHNGGAYQVVNSHKPDREDERQRIQDMGGEVMQINGTWRVNGNLAVSRSLGDVDYKDVIISTPEIVEYEAENLNGEYLVLASDGLWDVMDYGTVQIFVDHLLYNNKGLDAAHLLALEAKSKGSSDNISVIVVFLKPMDDLEFLMENRYPDYYKESEPPAIKEFEQNLNLLVQTNGSHDDEHQFKENGISSAEFVEFAQPELDLDCKEDTGAFSEPDEEWSFQPPPKVELCSINTGINVDDVDLLSNQENFPDSAPLMEITKTGVFETETEVLSNLDDLKLDGNTHQSAHLLDLNAENLIESAIAEEEKVPTNILDTAENLIGDFSDQRFEPHSTCEVQAADLFPQKTIMSVTELQKIENLVSVDTNEELAGVHTNVLVPEDIQKLSSTFSETMRLETAIHSNVKDVQENTGNENLEGVVGFSHQSKEAIVVTAEIIESPVFNIQETFNSEIQPVISEEKCEVGLNQEESSVPVTEPANEVDVSAPTVVKAGTVPSKSPIRNATNTQGGKKSDPKKSTGKCLTPSPQKVVKTNGINPHGAPSAAVTKRTVPEKALGLKCKTTGDVKLLAKSTKSVVSQVAKEVLAPKKNITQAKVPLPRGPVKHVGPSEPKPSGSTTVKITSRPLVTKASAVSPTKPGSVEVKNTAVTVICKSRAVAATARTVSSNLGIVAQGAKTGIKGPAKPIGSTTTVRQAPKPATNGTTKSLRPATARPPPTKPVVNNSTVPTTTRSTVPTSTRPTTARPTTTSRPTTAGKVTAKPDVKELSSKTLVKPLVKSIPPKTVAKKPEGTKSDASKKVVNGIGAKQLPGRKEPSKNAVEKKVIQKKVEEGVIVVESENKDDLISQKKGMVEIEGISGTSNLKEDIICIEGQLIKPEQEESEPLENNGLHDGLKGGQIREENANGMLVDFQEESGLQTDVVGNPVLAENHGGPGEMEYTPLGENGLMS